MKIEKTAEAIKKEFTAGQDYKSSIDLYDNYALNEDFYIGNQWRGVDADDIPKIIVNGLGRVVGMQIAKIATNDWTIQFTDFESSPENDAVAKMVAEQVDNVVERLNLKAKAKTALRNECVDGDACIFLDFDADADSGMNVPGMVTAEILENINVYFGNPYSRDVQSQPWIIVHQRRFLGDVQDEARKNKVKEEDVLSIKPDEDSNQMESNPSSLVSVFVKFWKENKTVHRMKTVNELVLEKEVDTGLKLYPITWSSWEIKKSSMHGQAMLTGLIDNQIAVNKGWSGIIYQGLKNGFAVPIVDTTRVKDWDGTLGRIIETRCGAGNVKDAVSYLEAAPLPMSIVNAVDMLMSSTRESMGSSDASTGNVRPDNAAAIIALQQADEHPLDLKRQAYHDMVEDMCRIIADIIRACYGKRKVMMDTEVIENDGKKTVEKRLREFDFSKLEDLQMRMKVDVGVASLYSEQLQVQTFLNMLNAGMLNDPATLAVYLKVMPEKYILGRSYLEDYLKTYLQKLMEQNQPQQINPTPTPIENQGEQALIDNNPAQP